MEQKDRKLFNRILAEAARYDMQAKRLLPPTKLTNGRNSTDRLHETSGAQPDPSSYRGVKCRVH